ncbi:MAG TPA: RNA polymerase sigma factor [Anaerolineales bacterium]|nr:RNA polymerase sigma factor [Anaerolineales bacterium]
MQNLEALIERWRGGDQQAAESIYNQHREQTFRLAYALLGNTEDAEEAAQDALTYALLHIHQFDPRRSKFTTWLHTITVSRSRDILRKRRLPTFPLIALFQNGRTVEDSLPGPEQRTSSNETRKSVWDAIQHLSPLLREAAVLRYWGNFTYQEIAEILGCTMKTAQSRVRLAHLKLASVLGENKLQDTAEETR